MAERPLAPEVLPRCPVCEKRIFCMDDADLENHVEQCFKAHSVVPKKPSPPKRKRRIKRKKKIVYSHA
jgi:hypothetical protein